MKTALLASTLLLSASLCAQNIELGFDDGWDTSFIDRIGGMNMTCDALNHFDNRHLLDWMLDPADPTGATYKFLGARLVTQDQVGNTPDSFDIVAYNEDVNVPNTPGTIWFRTGAINLPASTLTTPVAWIWTINFNPPAVPKGDKFIGAGLTNTTPAWPQDGISLHCAFDFNPPPSVTDRVGPGITSLNAGNLSCHMPTANGVPQPPAVFPARTSGGLRQIRLEIIAAVSGGVAVTQTNQTTYPCSLPGAPNSTPLGGTTNWISGVHPDVYDANASTPARADNIGFLYKDGALLNQPVFILLAFGGSPVGSTPITQLAPPTNTAGTRGNVCIDFVNAATFLTNTDANGVAQFMLTLNPQARAVVQRLAPFELWYQGFGLNAVAGGPPFEIHTSGCAKQFL